MSMDDARKPRGAQQSANEIFAAATREQRERRVTSAAERLAPPASRNHIAWAGIALVTPVFGTLLLINVFGISPLRLFESGPTPEVAQQHAQQLLETLVADIEAFRKDTGELPESLIEVGVPERGSWRYEVGGDGSYRLHGMLHGQMVTAAHGASEVVAKEEQ